MMEPPHVYTFDDGKVITVLVDPENGRWLAMLMGNPMEWSKVGSSEAEAIGLLVMALDARLQERRD